MASKKNRKQKRSSANPRNYSELYKDDKSTVTQSDTTKDAAKTESTETADLGKGSDSVDWKHDYAYVVKDLRQLLIVSGVLFVLVIGVGLLI
jgi:hypothetical protein